MQKHWEIEMSQKIPWSQNFDQKLDGKIVEKILKNFGQKFFFEQIF